MVKLKRLFNKRNAGGYTLVEVIVATALLGVLIVGVMGFITPVYGILKSSDEVKKAERAVATMEHYVSKSLRKSLYVKAYTNATLDDLNDPDGWIWTEDDDFKKMIDFFNQEGRKEDYTLRCLAFKYKIDNNIRNGSTGVPTQKYMIYTQTYNWETDVFEDEVNVFEECFYEDIYPKFSFEHRVVMVDPKTHEIVSTAPEEDPTEDPEDVETVESVETAGSTETADAPDTPATPIPLTPAVIMDVNIYNAEDIENNMNLLFTGRSFIEVNNVKSAVINQSSTYDYKIYEPYDMAADATYDGKDIYIIYVTRNVGTDVAGG